ncbi:MAG: S-methyl-5'-thioadenosine phosphorylase [Chloroflexi bacterium]|nr:S-methyl-5'-thioadenosine phosphorylase [Chloroflexota bacterium]
MAEQFNIGIIGGSGLYQMEALKDIQEISVDTPFGRPSDHLITGTLSGQRVVFIPRHGRGHVLNPSEVPYRANIYALKLMGVKYVVSVSAVGSLQEAFAPGHVAIPDQLVDFTKGQRDATFFEKGVVAHVGVADPISPELRGLLAEAVVEAGGTVHRDGKLITIEGPRFSTRGESNLYRQWGLDIIGMTACPEAFLAREAEMAYAIMAHVTDYDVWREGEEAVSAASVFETFHHNLKLAQEALVKLMPKIARLQSAEAHHALRGARATAPNRIPDDWHDHLAPLLKNLLN